MELPFERWLSDAPVPREASVAFNESCICYKAGAHRAALLFSYVGWGLTLRSRILGASVPAGWVAGQLDQIKALLQDEGKWDSEVFDCTQMKQPRFLFDVADDLRLQVKYWKDRRNDCAHFKDNTISAAHVEAFWQFVQSNLGKFVPSGSMDDLLRRIEQHFDPSLTPRGADFSPLAALVPSSVPRTDLPTFFARIVASFTRQLGILRLRRDSELATVFGSLLALRHASVEPALKAFIALDAALLTNVVRRDPTHLAFFAGNAQVIRNLWHQHLFADGQHDLPVYATMLRLALIPAGERTEANERTVQRLAGGIPAAPDIPTLEGEGFIQAFKKHAFDDDHVNQFGWGNANAVTIAWFLERYPIADDVARVICRTFSGPPYPFAAHAALRALFVGNAPKTAELTAAAARAATVVPPSLVT